MVMVDQPSVEDAISILRGLKERLEVFHGVRILDSALVAAVVLSNRYITDRFLPDKAIDLVDEGCAMLRTEIDSMPAELDGLTRRLTRLEIEEAALAHEDDAASKSRLEELRKELADVRSETDAMRAQWESERQALRAREISVTGGLGPTAGLIWRLGLMGEAARPGPYRALMVALEELLGVRGLVARFDEALEGVLA